jgi:NTE family protein
VSLVLAGGGIKGLAHIGVLRALEERGIEPSLVVGVSMGAIVASAWATGRRVREMEDRALALTRRDVFRIAHVDMALRRMLSPAVYRRDPLDRILDDLLGDRIFTDLPRRLLVNTVDLTSGHQMLWGLPGLRDVRVADAVFASCALPGILPPRRVGGHVCADGAVVDNLPVRVAAAVNPGPVLAVDLGSAGTRRHGIERMGFVATYGRGLEMVMGRLVEHTLRDWSVPPLVLIKPRVERVPMFAFTRTPFLIAEGYRATMEALDRVRPTLETLAAGVHPRRELELDVEPARCVGCGLCAALHPRIFRMGADGKALLGAERRVWSPPGDSLVRVCPTEAIAAREVTPRPGTTPH